MTYVYLTYSARAYAASQTTVLHMKRLSQTESPIFVILCVSKGITFRLLIYRLKAATKLRNLSQLSLYSNLISCIFILLVLHFYKIERHTKNKIEDTQEMQHLIVITKHSPPEAPKEGDMKNR